MSHIIHIGSNLDVLPTLPDNSIDSIVTDPPYGLGFMGKEWDTFNAGDSAMRRNPEMDAVNTGMSRQGGRQRACSDYQKRQVSDMREFQSWCETWARECFRVLKHGGHILSFGGSRTYHRMACAIEDAGFEVRDQIMWVYGSGFPKSHNISKAIDKKAGVERTEVIGKRSRNVKPFDDQNGWNENNTTGDYEYKAPATDDAKQWDGWGTALKPAHEPIVLARKPIEGTVAENVLKWGVGGLNIDGCRVGFVSDDDKKESTTKNQHEDFGTPPMTNNQVYGDYSMIKPKNYQPTGRFPANFMHDGSQQVLDLFPQSNGGHWSYKQAKDGGLYEHGLKDLEDGGSDKNGGSSARFFYCPKASKSDREEGCDDLPTQEKPAHMRTGNGTGETSMTDGFQATQRKNTHPTVKPTELMRYLCRLITPPGGTVLDPFMGSGSTGRGAILEGFNFIGIELSAEYAAIAEARIKASEQNNK